MFTQSSAEPVGRGRHETHINQFGSRIYSGALRQRRGRHQHGRARYRMAQSNAATQEPPVDDTAASARAPLSFVVDDEPSMRHFLSLILHGGGIDTEEFADGPSFRQAMATGRPELVFLNVGLESVDAIESVIALGKLGYFGFVQLMSNRGSAVLEHVKSVGNQHGLQMLPVLKKPFETSAILAIMQELKLGHPAPTAARIELQQAIKSGWIEFWYQPKIDLRKKQLAGVEAFARCRHPQFGILPPGAFMPGATEA